MKKVLPSPYTGTIIFLIGFLGFIAVSLVVLTLPPGSLIYNLLSLPKMGHLILGIPMWMFIIAVTNGIIYGLIIWLIYSELTKASDNRKKSIHSLP